MTTNNYKGFSYPFRFDSSGTTAQSELTPEDIGLIRDSLKQLWFTRKGERIMEPNTGSLVNAHMFENIGDITDQSILRFELLESAKIYERRVDIDDIQFVEIPERESTYLVIVNCKVVKYKQDVVIEFEVNLS